MKKLVVAVIGGALSLGMLSAAHAADNRTNGSAMSQDHNNTRHVQQQSHSDGANPRSVQDNMRNGGPNHAPNHGDTSQPGNQSDQMRRDNSSNRE